MTFSPEDHLVMTVVLDKDGRKLTYAGNNTNELAVMDMIYPRSQCTSMIMTNTWRSRTGTGRKFDSIPGNT